MDVSHMREVLTLAEHLNFTTAAAELYVSQPTLTRHIGAIEDKANSFIKLIVGIYAVGILLGIISGLVKFGDFMNGLVGVAAAVCFLVAYLSYLSLLRGAKDMLAR